MYFPTFLDTCIRIFISSNPFLFWEVFIHPTPIMSIVRSPVMQKRRREPPLVTTPSPRHKHCIKNMILMLRNIIRSIYLNRGSIRSVPFFGQNPIVQSGQYINKFQSFDPDFFPEVTLRSTSTCPTSCYTRCCSIKTF